MSAGRLDLPILPDTASNVLVACRNDRKGAREVAEILERDPSMTGHVLRTANSAAYLGSDPVESLNQAIVRLGLSRVAEVMLMATFKGRTLREPRFLSRIKDIREHSATAAAWARVVAQRRGANVHNAFLCGLMHDVGRSVLFLALLDIERETRSTYDDASVRAAVHELHPGAGAALIRRWNLAPWLADAVAWHHQWEAAPRHQAEAACASLCGALARWSLTSPLPSLDVLAAHSAFPRLGLAPADLDALAVEREAVLIAAGAHD